jgi:hypothetical protein
LILNAAHAAPSATQRRLGKTATIGLSLCWAKTCHWRRAYGDLDFAEIHSGKAAAGLVGSFWQFVFLGAGEAPMFSGAARVVRDWWNERDRGLPTGIGNCASSLGPTPRRC